MLWLIQQLSLMMYPYFSQAFCCWFSFWKLKLINIWILKSPFVAKKSLTLVPNFLFLWNHKSDQASNLGPQTNPFQVTILFRGVVYNFTSTAYSLSCNELMATTMNFLISLEFFIKTSKNLPTQYTWKKVVEFITWQH